MLFDPHVNFGFGTVTVAPSTPTSGTTFSMSNADAALFPNPSSGAYNLTVWRSNARPDSATAEIVRVTAKGSANSGGAGNTQFTITRQQEGSSARSILVGDFVANSITGKWWSDVENAINQKTLVTVGLSSGADYVCDGTADNVEIQAAIDAVNALGGGTVLVRKGSYSISSSITLKNNVALLGENRDTVLTLANAANTNLITSATGGLTNVSIRGFTFDGNRTNQTGGGTGGALIRISGGSVQLKEFYFENNTVQNSYQHAVFITGDDTTNFNKKICNNIKGYILNNKAGDGGSMINSIIARGPTI